MNKDHPDYLKYEYQCIQEHINRYNHQAWHWSMIREDDLLEAGFIHTFNQLRLSRRAKKENGNDTSFREYGLDALAKDGDTYHGLQAKYWTKRKLTANDIGTFISCMYNRMMRKNPDSKGYLYHTCKLQADLRDDLKNNPVIIPINLPYMERDDTIKVEIKNERDAELFDFQKDALDALKEDWDGMGLLQLPCGSGKTTILGHYLEANKPRVIIVLSPLRVHAHQTLDRLKLFLVDYQYLLVDSDDDGTRDADEIKRAVEKGNILISATFKSAEDILTEVFDDVGYHDVFITVDEAHNLISNDTVKQFVEKADKSLLLTATPPGAFEEEGVEVLFRYPFSKAIEEGRICDYCIYLPLIKKLDEDKTIIDITIPEELNMLDKEMTAKALYLATGMLRTGSRRCIVYLSSCEECEEFIKVFRKVVKKYHSLPVWTGKITNEVSSSNRTKLLQEFQDGDDHTLKILASVRIMDEGVDIPRCDSVFITKVGDKANDIRMTQRMCRANRIDKKNSNKVASCFLWCDEWNKIVNCFTILKEDDDVKFMGKIKIINGNYDGTERAEVKKEESGNNQELIKYLEIQCISLEERSMMRARELVKFYNDNNRLPSSKVKVHNENKIAQWLSDMKHSNNGKGKCCIYQSVKEYLNKEIPFWYQTLEDIALQNAYKLVQFYKQNQRLPSTKAKVRNEQKLASWLSCIKFHNKGKNKRRIYTSVKEYLNKELPTWYHTYEDNAMQNAHKLAQFYKQNQRLPSKSATVDSEKRLALWLKSIKQNNNGRSGLYVKEYLNKELPIWNQTREDVAIQNAYNLVQYYKQNQRLPSQSATVYSEKKLALWFKGVKRNNNGKGKLYPSVKEYLNKELPIWNESRGKKVVTSSEIDIVT